MGTRSVVAWAGWARGVSEAFPAPAMGACVCVWPRGGAGRGAAPGEQAHTAVQGQVPCWRRGPVEDGAVQEVDGGLGVNDLEDLAEQGAQLLSTHLQQQGAVAEPREGEPLSLWLCGMGVGPLQGQECADPESITLWHPCPLPPGTGSWGAPASTQDPPHSLLRLLHAAPWDFGSSQRGAGTPGNVRAGNERSATPPSWR